MFKPIQLSYLIRSSKQRKDGTVPIYLRIRVNGDIAELSASRTIDPDRWSSEKGRVKGSKPDANSLNSYLDLLKAEANEAHRKLLQEGREITAKDIKACMTGKDQEQKALLEIFCEHNERMKTLIGKDYSEATYKKYRTCRKHLEKFLSEEYNDPALPVSKVDQDFIEGLEYYLKTKDNPCSHNSALKYISHLKKIINIAKRKGWITVDPFRNYNRTYDKKEPVYLTQDELSRVESKEFEIERLGRVRDVFVFSCYTGLSFSDAEGLTASDIKTDGEGNDYLDLARTKTNESARIPLLPQAADIIEKYSDDPETRDGNLLPMISNQKTNAYLKEIANLCGITKKLTHHVARHTCATTVLLANGVPVETVQKILGHAQLTTTMHYARVTPTKVNNDLKSLAEKLKSA